MYVKICGLSTVESARVALEVGADAIGVVMSARSPRHVSPDTARTIVDFASGSAETVLVVSDLPASEAAVMAESLGIDVLQLHGAYTREDFADALALFPRVWRATSLATNPDLGVGAWGEEAILLDSPRAGSGESWDWTAVARTPPRGRWMLAGGLTPATVREAIATTEPWGVDVSSGVESAPGVKDAARIREFVAAAREA